MRSIDLSRVLLGLSLLFIGCAGTVSDSGADARATFDASFEEQAASPDVVLEATTTSTGCSVERSDHVVLRMAQQLYMGRANGLPTATAVQPPTSGGWASFPVRDNRFLNGAPVRWLGYVVSACTVDDYMQRRMRASPPATSFGFFSFSTTVEATSGRGLLTSEWSIRHDGKWSIDHVTGSLENEVLESAAATTVGIVSGPGGTLYEETWWVVCLDHGLSDPNEAQATMLDYPFLVWREGTVARCSHEIIPDL